MLFLGKIYKLERR